MERNLINWIDERRELVTENIDSVIKKIEEVNINPMKVIETKNSGELGNV